MDDYVKEDSKNKEHRPWWHLEGYMYDMLVFVSRVPEHITDASYVKSTISLVGSIRQQVGDQLLKVMEKLYQITPDKDNYTLYRIDLLKSLALNLQTQVNTWYTRITEQIKNH